MARYKGKNMVTQGLSGKADDDHVYKTIGGETFLCKKADMSGVVWSEKQKRTRERLREAQRYASDYIKVPAQRAAVERVVRKHERCYNRLISEFMHGMVRKPIVD
ncbi:hypothetical protein [Chryseolinea lacunae]|uniref:Uncharacterized protein n=1 Tax=Chryseolinea lacunae TaxID=2801331 RepID=A0ABS1L0W5_9BACT|nr:hypothetical protein [Chryseolinea lacunae]MBL0745330.1 hypothetical protein [Chryseolinea lacunae]